MTIKRFYSRSELGMRRPRSVSRNITPGNGGVAVHYGGAAQGVTTESQAKARWLGWQRFHMDSRGWVDIAYTAGFDNWGNVYAGRGYGVRTAAQGTNTGNQNNYAFVWIGGGNEVPSKEAYAALNWLINDARRNGGAGLDVRPHSYFKSSACPGTYMRNRAGQLHRRTSLPKPEGEPVQSSRNYVTVGDKGSRVTEWQELLIAWSSDALPRFGADGDFGGETAEWTVKFYDAVGLTASDPDAPRVGETSFNAIRDAIEGVTAEPKLDELRFNVDKRKSELEDLVERAGNAERTARELEQQAADARKLANELADAAAAAATALAQARKALDDAIATVDAEREARRAAEQAEREAAERQAERDRKAREEAARNERNYVTVGDAGPEVKTWQQDLRRWDSRALPRFGADGDFGSETLTWTLRFYDSVGMSVSDRSEPKVGPKSREAMAKALASFKFRHTALIRKGDNGAAVTEWQTALRKWNRNALPRFGADGDFGNETDDWTRRFQRSAGIGVDGVVGPQTRRAMEARI